MKRNLSIATALAMSLLVAPACKKEEKKSDDPAAKVQDKASGDSAKTGDPAAARPASSGEMLAYLPAQTEMLFSLSTGEVMKSSLWSEVQPALANAGDGELKEAQEACGFDPLEKLKGVYMGANSQDETGTVIVVEGFSRDEVSKCVTAMAEKKGEKVEVSQDGNFTIVKGDTEDKNVTIGWAGATTMVIAPEKNDKEFLQARMDGKDSAKSNAELVAIAAKANQSAPLWFAGLVSDASPLKANMGAMGASPNAFYGSLGMSKGLQIDLGLSFADEAAANQTLSQAKMMLPMAKGSLGPEVSQIVDKVAMAASGPDMTIKLELTEADLEAIKKSAGPMLGGMGGL